MVDVKLFGCYVMFDVDYIGGVLVVMKVLLDVGLLYGDCLMVIGYIMVENLVVIILLDLDGKVLCVLVNLIYLSGGIIILYGLLVFEGVVVKIVGFDFDVFEGIVRVFDGECVVLDVFEDGIIIVGDVVVIWYEGFKGGFGMCEMFVIIGVIKGVGFGKDVLLLIDGWFFGGIIGLCVGYIVLEVVDGGLIVFLCNGDWIWFDVVGCVFDVLVDLVEFVF